MKRKNEAKKENQRKRMQVHTLSEDKSLPSWQSERLFRMMNIYRDRRRLELPPAPSPIYPSLEGKHTRYEPLRPVIFRIFFSKNT